jgi:hypothetical protein
MCLTLALPYVFGLELFENLLLGAKACISLLDPVTPRHSVKKSHVSFGPTCTCVKYIFVVDFKQCVQVVYINKIMD